MEPFTPDDTLYIHPRLPFIPVAYFRRRNPLASILAHRHARARNSRHSRKCRRIIARRNRLEELWREPNEGAHRNSTSFDNPLNDSHARRLQRCSERERRGCNSRAVIAVVAHADAREAPAQRAVTIKATSEF